MCIRDRDFCAQVKTVESFIDPSESTQFPIKSVSELQHFSLQKIAEAVVNSTEYDSLSVVSSTRTISLDDLLIFEPYAEIGVSLLLMLDKDQSETKLPDKFLRRISNKLSKKADIFIIIFKSKLELHKLPSPTTSEHLFAELQKWRDGCEGTYKCLKEKVDQFSIFAGRNILVSISHHCVFVIHILYM